METSIITIHNYFFVGVTVLFLFQSIVLFARSKNNKVRRSMAILELLWGLEYLVALILMQTMNPPEEYSLFREKVLVVGSYYISFAVLFPMQVLMPGWLTWKRIFLLELPIVSMTALFYGGMALLGEVPENYYSYAELMRGICHFNVWFRFVMLLIDGIYFGFILWWLYGYEKRYVEWKNENFSDQDYVDISWMRAYDYMIVGIFLFYLGILVVGGRIAVMCHCSFVIISYSYIFYKTLFYENPYPEDFFACNENMPSSQESVLPVAMPEMMETDEELSDSSFMVKMDEYMATITRWMEEEKPFLYKDFKLTDVSRVVDLNRSYLSRIFNEGYQKNFSEVVREYRVAYSKTIMKNNPNVPMYKVAELSGFNSDSTFLRAFKQFTGMTPTQYKINLTKEL